MTKVTGGSGKQPDVNTRTEYVRGHVPDILFSNNLSRFHTQTYVQSFLCYTESSTGADTFSGFLENIPKDWNFSNIFFPFLVAIYYFEELNVEVFTRHSTTIIFTVDHFSRGYFFTSYFFITVESTNKQWHPTNNNDKLSPELFVSKELTGQLIIRKL